MGLSSVVDRDRVAIVDVRLVRGRKVEWLTLDIAFKQAEALGVLGGQRIV